MKPMRMMKRIPKIPSVAPTAMAVTATMFAKTITET